MCEMQGAYPVAVAGHVAIVFESIQKKLILQVSDEH